VNRYLACLFALVWQGVLWYSNEWEFLAYLRRE
jgi:hypothetical protein